MIIGFPCNAQNDYRTADETSVSVVYYNKIFLI